MLHLGVPGLRRRHVHVGRERHAQPRGHPHRIRHGVQHEVHAIQAAQLSKMELRRCNIQNRNLAIHGAGRPRVSKEATHDERLEACRRDETNRISRLQAVGPGVLFGQQDRVGIGEETERISQFRRGAAVFADAPVTQNVHAQDEEHLARSAGDRRHGLDDWRGVGDAGRPGDPGKECFVQSGLARRDLQAALAHHMIEAMSERVQHAVVGQPNGQCHRHAQRDPQNRDERSQPVAA